MGKSFQRKNIAPEYPKTKAVFVVRLVHGCDLYTGRYGMVDFQQGIANPNPSGCFVCDFTWRHLCAVN